jgi:hypothetical protein
MSDLKSIFDAEDLESIDAQINAEMSRGTLVERMQETSEKQEAKKMDWMQEFKRYWYIYVPLCVSALFTIMLGIYLGLDPQRITNADGSQSIYWHTDWPHIIMAAIFAAAFFVVTELMVFIGKIRYQAREEGNPTQRNTAWWVTAVAFVSVMVTGIAGFRIVASNIAMLRDFQEIPHDAQIWVSIAIPILITFYGVLLVAYANSSAHEKAKRLASENKRKQDLDQEVRMTAIEQLADRAFQVQEIKAFERAVMKGLITATEAAAARRAGKTLQQLEKELGRGDLNEDGIDESRLSARLQSPAPRPAPAPKNDSKADFMAGKYDYLRPPHGDRQHPDLLQARIPMDVWEVIIREWAIQGGMNPDNYLSHLDEQIRSIPQNRTNGQNFH